MTRAEAVLLRRCALVCQSFLDEVETEGERQLEAMHELAEQFGMTLSDWGKVTSHVLNDNNTEPAHAAISAIIEACNWTLNGDRG